MTGEKSGRSPRVRGSLAALTVLVVVAVPAIGSAVLAVISFTGCLVECTAPHPARGAWWATLAVGLLSLPLVVGLAVARRPPGTSNRRGRFGEEQL